SKLSLL
ncbi:hypothetical protein VCHENC02_4860B, partial [Vibrio harveyi]